MGLTAVILTNKSQKDITKTVNSVAFADEIIIICDGLGKSQVVGKTKTIFHPLENNFSAQRNLGLKSAENEWVLFIDDDEIVSPSLAIEIKGAINNPEYSGYYLQRLDQYHLQTLHHGETGNIKIVRLAQKSAGKFIRSVHETWEVSGKLGILVNPLIHIRNDLTETFINKISFYGKIDAKELNKEGKPFTYWRLALNPKGKFLMNYFLKLGFLDGYAGLFQAYLMSIQSLSVRIFQWQKN